MPCYVALPGSINVGGNQLKMADLRAVLEEDGFENVGTVIASGNVVHVDFVGGVARSKLTTAFIEKRLGCRGTARNLRSLQRILEKMD